MSVRSPYFSLLIALLASALMPAAQSADSAVAWTQFRGPSQGHADNAKVSLTWSEKEHVKWKTPLPGEGWSSPVVANGQIWMTTALEEGKSLHALCCNLQTGQLVMDVEVFKNEVARPKHDRNSYASPTPVIDGDRLYVHFGPMGTACLSTRDGRKIWENRDLKIDTQNGPGGSASLYKNKLLIDCDGMDFQYGVALDKATGKIVWKTERSAIPKLAQRPPDRRKAYGTPVVLEIDGHSEALSTGAERLYSADPDTGKELWSVDYPGFSNVPLPVSDGKLVFVCTGFGRPEIWGIRLAGAKGDVTASNVVWKQPAGAPDQSTPVVVGDRIYMITAGSILSCLDSSTGKIVWKERIGGDYAASPLAANGRIYLFSAIAGKTTVIEPGDQFKVLATNILDDGCMASPAIVGNTMIVRTKKNLYRIED